MKNYTDLEQAQKLAEFLPIESADMWYDNNGESIAGRPEVRCCSFVGLASINIPCWSLAALLDVLPEGVFESYYVPNIQKEGGRYSIAYGDEKLLYIADNPVDACVKMILKLHEQNIL